MKPPIVLLVDWAWRLRHDGEARLKALKALAGGDA